MKQAVELNNKNILVTGSSGFIGAKLVERLLSFDLKEAVVGVDNVNDYFVDSL